MSALPRVIIETPFGSMTVEVDEVNAPISAANFLAYVDQGLFTGTTVHRIVSKANQPEDHPAKIEVIQFGHVPVDHVYPTPLPFIAHEPTNQTGLRHLDGTLSMARFDVGTASSGVFICVGDQPELDFGGKRQPDGQGFAAFGRVVDGIHVLYAIHAMADETDVMSAPVPLTSVRRA